MFYLMQLGNVVIGSEKIITGFSNLKQLKRLYLLNCILSRDTINSFVELNNLEELIINSIFLKNEDELVNLFVSKFLCCKNL